MAATVTVRSRARPVCESCAIADTVWTRLRGLMGRELEPGEGLLLRPSGSVHTCFMRFAIDVVFLDSELRVLAVSPAVRPWRLRLQRGARAVLELPAGQADRVGISAGDHLALGRSATNNEKEKAHVLA
jgi:uncharacterized protein